jgi:uncharacterized protein (DUF924 family)
VELISALGDAELTNYAQAHKAVIDRFGRFPHRNAILGRTSTAEELEFLMGQAVHSKCCINGLRNNNRAW